MITTGPAGHVRRWVDLYTRGLPTDVRDRRRTEIDADLWSQLEEAALLGRRARSTNAEILTRWLTGIPADLSWRLEQRGDTMDASTEPRISSPGAVGHGLTTILAGAALIIVYVGAVALFAGMSPNDLTWTSTPVVILVRVMQASAALLGASLFAFAIRYQDRFSPYGIAAAAIGGLAGILTAAGAYQLFALLPVATAIVAWNLARLHTIPRSLAVLHAASAALSVVVNLAGMQGAALAQAQLVAGLSWPVTLAIIGRAIMRGERAPTPRTGGTAEAAHTPAPAG